MIRAGVSEIFPITATLIDEINSVVSTGNVVLYEIRQQPNDTPLTPILSGVFVESATTPGIYIATLVINEIGSYVVYVSCSGFTTSTEEIIIEAVSTPFIGCNVPEVISESFGSINMTVTKDNVRFSTKSFIPSISVSTGV
jgi:hypothetical protein